MRRENVFIELTQLCPLVYDATVFLLLPFESQKRRSSCSIMQLAADEILPEAKRPEHTVKPSPLSSGNFENSQGPIYMSPRRIPEWYIVTVPRLIMHGAIPPLPYMPSWRAERELHLCEIWGSHSGFVVGSGRLGCDAVPLVVQCLRSVYPHHFESSCMTNCKKQKLKQV